MASLSAAASHAARVPWTTAIAVLAAALLFCWPAFYNGYPLTYGDSASYLDTIDPSKAYWSRPVFYTIFLLPFHMRIWLWPAIFVQSLILAHLLYVVIRAICGRIAPENYLLFMVVLAGVTTLPWFTSMIMPYAFTSVVVLGLFLLGFMRDRLSRPETWYLALLTAGAITVHLSHLGLAVGLLVVILALRFYLEAGPRTYASAALVALPIAAALAAQVAVSSYARGAVSLAPSTPIFLLARAIADGPAVAYLREACPERKFILCDHLDELPADANEFLFPHDGVFHRAGGASALRDEAREIVSATWRAYPGWQLANAASHAVRQFFNFQINELLFTDEVDAVPGYPISQYVRHFFPGAYADYLASRQNTGRLPTMALDLLHGFVTIISFVASLFLLIEFARRNETVMFALLIVVIAALVGNAIISGVVSGVHGHYQGRLTWLLTLCAVLGGLRVAMASAAQARSA